MGAIIATHHQLSNIVPQPELDSHNSPEQKPLLLTMLSDLMSVTLEQEGDKIIRKASPTFLSSTVVLNSVAAGFLISFIH